MSRSRCNPNSDKVRILSSCDRPVYVKSCDDSSDNNTAQELANLNETLKAILLSGFESKQGEPYTMIVQDAFGKEIFKKTFNTPREGE